VTTALPYSTPIAPSSSHGAPATRPAPVSSTRAAAPSSTPQAPRDRAVAPLPPRPAPLPRSTPERLLLGRERIRSAAEAGQRIRSYEVALDLDLSEFHFARLFRAAFGLSPHVYYDEVRAERARALLREGLTEGEVARRIGFRRPAELRALLSKRGGPATASAAAPSDASTTG
jgi:AraC family transcriptional regulator